jgi:hypothetical protein
MKMQLQFASVFYTFDMPSEGTEKKQRAESTKFRAAKLIYLSGSFIKFVAFFPLRGFSNSLTLLILLLHPFDRASFDGYICISSRILQSTKFSYSSRICGTVLGTVFPKEMFSTLETNKYMASFELFAI